MSDEIVVIVPVLGRPGRVEPLIESYERAATVQTQLLFVTSPGDEEETEAIRTARATSIEALWEAGPSDYAMKINWATAWSRIVFPSPFVFAGADDLCFCDGWDQAALDVAESTGAGMIGTDDLWNSQVMRGLHSTHSLFRRAYVDVVGASWDGPGTVYSEAYDHQWIDTEAVAVAKSRGQFAFAFGSRVEHLHPFAGKSERDPTYEKALRASAADHSLFLQRQRKFG